MAATPVDPRVADHHRQVMLALPGNGNSAEHAHGVAAAETLEAAAVDVGRFACRPASQVYFIPGASAALWLAIEDVIATSARPPRIVASAAEHPSLLAHLRQAEAEGRAAVTIFAVDAAGLPRLDALAKALVGGADLVCAMAANNEVGTITAMGPIATQARDAGARLLVDASQVAGRSAMTDYGVANYLVLSGAKMYGPRRVGVLVGDIGEKARFRGETLFGSPDVAAASAMAKACTLRAEERDMDEARIGTMRDRLQSLLVDAIPDLVVNGTGARRVAGSLHISVPDMPGEAVVARLWNKVSLSTGAACQSGAPGPSHVLLAMGVTEWIADGAVRIGVGRFNQPEEMDEAGAFIAAAMLPEDMRRRA